MWREVLVLGLVLSAAGRAGFGGVVFELLLEVYLLVLSTHHQISPSACCLMYWDHRGSARDQSVTFDVC
jgi:hypothetical protein